MVEHYFRMLWDNKSLYIHSNEQHVLFMHFLINAEQ